MLKLLPCFHLLAYIEIRFEWSFFQAGSVRVFSLNVLPALIQRFEIRSWASAPCKAYYRHVGIRAFWLTPEPLCPLFGLPVRSYCPSIALFRSPPCAGLLRSGQCLSGPNPHCRSRRRRSPLPFRWIATPPTGSGWSSSPWFSSP